MRNASDYGWGHLSCAERCGAVAACCGMRSGDPCPRIGASASMPHHVGTLHCLLAHFTELFSLKRGKRVPSTHTDRTYGVHSPSASRPSLEVPASGRASA